MLLLLLSALSVEELSNQIIGSVTGRAVGRVPRVRPGRSPVDGTLSLRPCEFEVGGALVLHSRTSRLMLEDLRGLLLLGLRRVHIEFIKD